MPSRHQPYCPLVSVSWSGLLDWTGAVAVLGHGVSLTSVTSHKRTSWYTKAILSEKCCNPFHQCLKGAIETRFSRDDTSPIRILSTKSTDHLNCRQTGNCSRRMTYQHQQVCGVKQFHGIQNGVISNKIRDQTISWKLPNKRTGISIPTSESCW